MIKTPFYTVIEKQVLESGAAAQTAFHFDDKMAAYARLYQILSAASTSGLPYHAAWMIDDEGAKVDGRAFDRREEAE